MSTVAIPEMKKYNYKPELNAGAVAAGATLGVLIPPSIVLVIYGLYTGQPIGTLFFGNVIPSIILTGLIAATVFYICWRHPDWGPKGPRSTWRERFGALPDLIEISILFGIIMYALFTGYVTATEAAAASNTTTTTNSCPGGKYFQGKIYMGQPSCSGTSALGAYLQCDATGYYCCASSQGASSKCGSGKYVFQPGCTQWSSGGGSNAGPQVQNGVFYGCYKNNP
jgi:hypothetical protein